MSKDENPSLPFSFLFHPFGFPNFKTSKNMIYIDNKQLYDLKRHSMMADLNNDNKSIPYTNRICILNDFDLSISKV